MGHLSQKLSEWQVLLLGKQNKAGLTQKKKKVSLVSSMDQNALEVLKQFKMAIFFLVSLMEN